MPRSFLVPAFNSVAAAGAATFTIVVTHATFTTARSINRAIRYPLRHSRFEVENALRQELHGALDITRARAAREMRRIGDELVKLHHIRRRESHRRRLADPADDVPQLRRASEHRCEVRPRRNS